MKIVHTGDWHLGKHLEGQSRLEEQMLFLEDFVKLVKSEEADLVIIAGDVYDNFTPPSKAESMFYNTLYELSEEGKRLILIIAGNHDSPDRLVAASSLAQSHGILMVGTPKTVVPVGKYGLHEVVHAEEGVIELIIHQEKVVVLTLPFPSEKRLNEVLYGDGDDEEKLESYESRIKEWLDQKSKYYREDTINLFTTHLFVMGSEEGGSERSIQLGGSYLINSAILPEKAQYMALGHVHKPQLIPGTKGRARYSGSPIHYHKGEISYEKSVEVIEVKAGEEAVIRRVPLKVYKPIEVWKCENFQEALTLCEENSDRACWVYLEIKTETYIKEDQIKQLKGLKRDILSIRPITPEDLKREEAIKAHQNLSFESLFELFYEKERGIPVEEATKEMLYKIVHGEVLDETD